jgi:hypothetical protein
MSEDWVDELEAGSPDIVAAWRGIEAGRLIEVRREVRRRGGPGTAESGAGQLGALETAMAAIVEALPDDAFGMPGGEQDWNVAQAIGHDADARAGLAIAAQLAATDRWPADAPVVVPGVPGPAEADRPALLRRLAVSQRIVMRAARAVAGNEATPCPLVHEQVGRLRCGEWLVFAGVHDLMHLQQLHELRARIAAGVGVA